MNIMIIKYIVTALAIPAIIGGSYWIVDSWHYAPLRKNEVSITKHLATIEKLKLVVSNGLVDLEMCEDSLEDSALTNGLKEDEDEVNIEPIISSDTKFGF